MLSLLTGLLMAATAAPASPAEPLGATAVITAPAAWAGHPACGAQVQVTLSGDSLDVGAYETRLSFNTAYLGYTSGRISQSDFLTDGGTRSTGGDEGTIALESISTGSVKFGDYSWGTNSGADADGSTLATVQLDVVKCGASNLSLSETQIVNYTGDALQLTSQAVNVPLQVNHQLNINGDAIPVVTGQDVLAVANALNASATCSTGYQYNANGDNIPVVTGQDVLTVANALNTSVACP
jgi:hypothetical protein